LKNTFLNILYFDVQTEAEGSFIGNNQKHLLIVIADESDKNDANTEFLSKIIAAIQYNLNDDAVRVFIENDTKLTISTNIMQYNSKDILIFGLSNQQLGIFVQQKKYQPFELQGVRYLFADNLSEIQTQKELKGALWDALKRMFLALS
jgi:DNA polymerase III psi subunit